MSELDFQFLERETRKYKDLSEEELLSLMLKEWYSAGGDINKIPVRGAVNDFLKGTIKRLARKIVENRATVSAAFGLAVGEVVSWAKTQGLDLTAYRIFISVMAAAVANSVIEELDSQTK